jgi:hypothetical protein
MTPEVLISLFIIVGAVIATVLISIALSISALPTWDQYVAEHPETQSADGVHCYRCGSRHIELWTFFEPAFGSPKVHVCRHCGTRLYRS